LTVAVGTEHELLTVRRPARKYVLPRALGDIHSLTAVSWYHVHLLVAVVVGMIGDVVTVRGPRELEEPATFRHDLSGT
jgi:hypothetical protein